MFLTIYGVEKHSVTAASVWLKKVENPNFFVFNPICLKFGIGGNFEMLITKK